MTLKISLVDNDYVVRAKTDLPKAGKDSKLEKFLKEVDEELITGKTAYLEIEGYKRGPVTFEISKFE
ncbi:hypothetical protein OAC89_04375 [Deltaproteobacteria bacterium]|nr:hypothetical protein [Deltaproteobacteria bacterium]